MPGPELTWLWFSGGMDDEVATFLIMRSMPGNRAVGGNIIMVFRQAGASCVEPFGHQGSHDEMIRAV